MLYLLSSHKIIDSYAEHIQKNKLNRQCNIAQPTAGIMSKRLQANENINMFKDAGQGMPQPFSRY